MRNPFFNQPSSVSAGIKKDIKLVVWSFVGAGFSIGLAMVIDYFFSASRLVNIILYPFVVLFLLFLAAFTYFMHKVNSKFCQNCGKRLGMLYGFFPFAVFHDFDLEKCKHCGQSLS